MKKLILLIALIAFSFSCTMYHKSSKLRKSYSKNYRQVKKVNKSMKKDFEKRKGIYDSLNLEYDNYLANKKPKLAKTLSKMKKIVDKLGLEQKNAFKLKDDINRLTKNKKKIKSNRPEWEKHNKIEDKAKKIHSRVEDLINEYEDLSRDYNNTLKASSVKKVKVNQIKKQFKKSRKKLNKAVMKFENQVNVLWTRYTNDSDKMEKLDKLKNLLTKIKEEWTKTSKLVELFNLRLGNKKTVYIIENQDNVIMRIKKSYDEVNRLGREINKISKKL